MKSGNEVLVEWKAPLSRSECYQNEVNTYTLSYLFGSLRQNIRWLWSCHGSYFGKTQSSQNTLGENKHAWFAAKASKKVMIRYLLYLNLAKRAWYRSQPYQVSGLILQDIMMYIITKSICAFWLVNQLWLIVLVNSWKNRASSELLYTWRIRKSLACGSWFT